MCSNFIPTVKQHRLLQFGLSVADDWSSPIAKYHIWNHYPAPFIVRHNDHNSLITGEFGLIPYFAKEGTSKYSTFNARSETAEKLPTFRHAWKNGQRCIIPVDVFYEPDWRSGKAVWTGFSRNDEEPMGIAGLWDRWVNPQTGEVKSSFTMLTINADDHALMKNYHKPNDEKRMVVILPETEYKDWLTCPPRETMEYLNQYPAELLKVVAKDAG